MSNQQPSFDTVTEALQWLTEQGFNYNFNLHKDCISFSSSDDKIPPEEFTIDYLFRFEGQTDPGDEDIVYGITSERYNMKGVMTSAYGMYADELSPEMMRKLTISR